MMRAAGLLIRMMLRAAIGFTVAMWGVTRIQAVICMLNFAHGSCGVAIMPEGITIACMSVPSPVAFATADVKQVGPWGLVGASTHLFLPGFHFWHSRRTGAVQVGVTYPAAIIFLLLLYAVFGRRRRNTRRTQERTST